MTKELELDDVTTLSAPDVTSGVKAPEDRKAMPVARKKPRAAMLAIAGVVVAGVAAGGAYLHFAAQVSTDDAQVDAHNAPVAPKISGTILQILVDDNQPVKAGQVLARIDPRDYQARVDQANAALAMAQSDSIGARANVPLTDHATISAVASAEGQLAAAEADYEKTQTDFDRDSTSEVLYAQADVESKRATRNRAQSDLARMEPLVSKEEISKQQYDSYFAAARVAESDLTGAEQSLANARKKADSSKAEMLTASAHVDAARADLEQAKANRQKVEITSAQANTAVASIQQARANLETARLQLSYTEIVAPIDGLVTRKMIQVGQIVQLGQTLLTIVPVKEVWITANFKETQLAGVHPGQPVEIDVDMYGRSFRGEVDSIAAATGADMSLLPPENATGNYVKVVQRIPVKIVLKNAPADFVFRPGMNVTATIATK